MSNYEPKPGANRDRRLARMAELAAQMRAYHLSHGSGCKARKRAIERRMNATHAQ